MSELLLTDAYEIAAYIKAAEKQTPIKLYIKGDFENPAYEGLKFFGSGDSYTVFGDASAIYPFLKQTKTRSRIKSWNTTDAILRFRCWTLPKSMHASSLAHSSVIM